MKKLKKTKLVGELFVDTLQPTQLVKADLFF